MLDLDLLERLHRAASPAPWRSGSPAYRCVIDHEPHGGPDCDYRFFGWGGGPSEIYQDRHYDQWPGADADPVASGMICGYFAHGDGGVVEQEDTDLIVAIRNALPEILRLLQEVKNNDQ